MRWLSMREHSRYELTQKLTAKDPQLSRAEIGALLDACADSGEQSDARYAEALVRSRRAKGYGRQRIVAELRQHQIAATWVEEAFASSDAGEETESMRCLVVLTKWMRRQTKPTPEKAYRFLQTKGFNFSEAQQAVEQIFR
ncbi:MAG: recombination regulator RecX [Litorivicinaceae bacterium]|nr:recombination regulator RecX [Litorivicinaceae bacterium]MDP5329182.1 recombination regulator RecX [Litorivicinaceae bacterium]MDP5331184.1 recombination regulator RecX [Litorivicinaceae bacterium]MDP5341297.1 recombination regulator RecX [Litorivicinaceae bacterium]MDP5342476.1 recombination regulator RecX [Litorivicinaceae bacterium]